MMMVGFEKREVEEEYYLEYISGMSDERLEKEAGACVWLCETSLGGPWEIYAWKRDFVRDELERRGHGERFERAQARIVAEVERRGLSGRGKYCP